MIWSYLISAIVWVLNALTSWLPSVNTLPTIGGVDIDTALVGGVAQAYQYASTFWMIGDVLIGALFIWGYYIIKMLVRILLGSRAPH